MARPQAADYEQRREAIVGKAAELFARKGFRGASMSQLAVVCKTSKSLVYHYYASKEDVLYAVMASHIDQLLEEVAEAEALPRPPQVALGDLLKRFMRRYVSAVDRQKVLLNELHNLTPDRRKVIVKKQRGLIDAVQALLTAIHPALGSDPVHARVRTMLLFGMINWTHTWFHASGPVSADEVAEMALALASAPITGR